MADAFDELHRAWRELWDAVWTDFGDLMTFLLIAGTFVLCLALATGDGIWR
jgi:hypothetical protein